MITSITEDSEDVRQGLWRGSDENHLFFRKGDAVVITKADGEFVTILDNGIDNKWFTGATPIQ
jgi:hypothetical protein